MHTRLPTCRLAVALLGLAFARHSVAVDVLLLNGHVFTGNGANPWAESLAVGDGRVKAVGSNADIEALRSGATRVINLQGRTVLPGFIDSHLHMQFGALELHGLNLSTPESSVTLDNNTEQFVLELSRFAASHPEDEVLFGRADFNFMEPLAPDHTVLDRAVPGRPVVIHNTTEHALLMNATALRMAGVSRAPLPDPNMEKGVVRDAYGNPTGLMLEAAMNVEQPLVERIPREKRLAIIKQAATYLNSLGITSVVNATGDLEEIGLYATLHERGQLTVRTRTAFGSIAEPHRLTPRFVDDLETARRRYADAWVSAGLVKFFADGDTGLYPPLVYNSDDFRRLVFELDRRGFQLMTHALRTDTVAMVLDAYEAASKTNGPRDRRLRLEHAELINDPDITRLSRLGVIAGMQPGFCCAENGLNWDPRRTEATDRWRTFKDRGVRLAFGSDWPCLFPPDPMMGIRVAVTRQVWKSSATASILGQPLDGAGQGGAVAQQTVYTPREKLTVTEAVEAYTSGSAYATFQEKQLGTLEPGKRADLIVLSQDIFSIAPETISTTRVLLTMVDGKVVYEASSERGAGH